MRLWYFVVTMVTILEQKHYIWKQRKLFYVEMLLCCYSRKRYLSKLKQHGLPDAYIKEFSFQCLPLMIYEQFIVSIVELIMLSWQPILVHNFHNMRVTWLFYHFFKLQVQILYGLENTSIFNTLKLWLVTSFSAKRSSYYRKFPKISELRRSPFDDSLARF